MKQLILEASGPYSLGASIQFLEGFAPAAYESEMADHLHLAFVVDGGLAYGPERRADGHEIQQVAEAWRPYRTWAAFLLRVLLEEETHEIAQGSSLMKGTTRPKQGH